MSILNNLVSLPVKVYDAFLGRAPTAASVPDQITTSGPPSLPASDGKSLDTAITTRAIGRPTKSMHKANHDVKTRLAKDKYALIDNPDDDIDEPPEPKGKGHIIFAQEKSASKPKSSSYSELESDERRLLGLAEPQPDHAVAFDAVTTRPVKDMAFKQSRHKFLAGGPYRPQNTLGDEPGNSKSQYLRQKTSDLRPNLTTEYKRPSASSKSTVTVRSPEGQAVKKARTVSPVKSVPATPPESSASTNGKYRHKSRSSIGSMYGMNDPNAQHERQSKAKVKHNALRDLHKTADTRRKPRREASPDDLMDVDDNFTKQARHERESGRQTSEDEDNIVVGQAPSKKPHSVQQFEDRLDKVFAHSADRKTQRTPSNASKMQRRLANESPDVLSKGFSSPLPGKTDRTISLSPPDSPEPPSILYHLRTFAFPDFVVASDTTLALCPTRKAFKISYKEAADAARPSSTGYVPLEKIHRVTLPEDDKCDILQLHFVGHILAMDSCFLEFKSQKARAEFSSKIQEIESTIKVNGRPSSFFEKAMTRASLTRDSRTRRQSHDYEQSANPAEPVSRAAAPWNNAQQRRPRKVDSLDAPPKMRSDGQVPSVGTTRRSKATEEYHSEHNQVRGSDMSSPSTRQTRSRGRQSQRERSESPISVEPRRVGPPWTNALLYPATGKRSMVTWDDLAKLEDKEFLNDSIVDLFIRYLQNNISPDIVKKMHFFSTFFYERLTARSKRQIDYDAVKNWTKTINIFTRDYIVIPICENAHWYVMIVCNPKALGEEEAKAESESETGIVHNTSHEVDSVENDTKDILKSDLDLERSQEGLFIYSDDETAMTPRRRKAGRKSRSHTRKKYDTNAPVIITLDSLDIPRSTTAGLIKDYLIQEGKTRNKEIEKGSIQGMSAKDIPHQPNWYDCGIYLCMYLEQFMADPPKFIESLLQREKSIAWPKRLKSADLRQRLYDTFVELHKAQEDPSYTANVARIGQILLKPKDSRSPPEKETKHDPKDTQTLRKNLDFADSYLRNGDAGHSPVTEEELRQPREKAGPPIVGAPTSKKIASGQRHDTSEAIVIEDNEERKVDRPRKLPQQNGDENENRRTLHVWNEGWAWNEAAPRLNEWEDHDPLFDAIERCLREGSRTLNWHVSDGRTIETPLVWHKEDFDSHDRTPEVTRENVKQGQERNTNAGQSARSSGAPTKHSKQQEDGPAQLAMRLARQRNSTNKAVRSPAKQQVSRQTSLVDLTTPSQELEEPRHERGTSITTDFLEGDQSYQNEPFPPKAPVQKVVNRGAKDDQSKILSKGQDVTTSRFFEKDSGSGARSPSKQSATIPVLRLTQEWDPIEED